MTAAIVQHDVTVYLGDALDVLRTLPDSSVQCVCTSPPYYGLRDYGVAGQLGLESSPTEYVAAMVGVFREARRVLAGDGVLWLNLGSSYANGSSPGPQGSSGQRATRTFTAAGQGYVVGAARPDVPSSGTPCTERSGSPGPGSSCPDLCDGCAAAQSSRSADTGRHEHAGAQLRERTARDTARPGSASASPDDAPHGAPVSTIQRSSQPPPASCSHCDNCGACLAVLRSSSRDARLCARTEPYTRGTSQPASGGRNQGTDALGTAWVNYTAALGPKSLIPIPWMVAMSLQADGWILRNSVIWNKPNAMPESVTDRLSTRYEHVFLFSKSRRYWFGLDAIREQTATVRPGALSWDRDSKEALVPGQSQRQHRSGRETYQTPGRWADGSGGRHRDSGPDGLGANAGGRNPGDVWTVATSPFPGAHFATMPPELARRCILAGCPESGTVLDPFTGSGTTAMVARSLGRKFIGAELNPDYIPIIESRIGPEPFQFGEVTA